MNVLNKKAKIFCKKVAENLEVMKKCVPLQSQTNKAVVVKW